MDTKVLLETFRGLPHQGPGNEECTLRALALVGELPLNPRILDVGCGSGRQSLILARRCGGQLLAVDLDPNSRLFGDVVEVLQQPIGNVDRAPDSEGNRLALHSNTDA